MLPLLALRHYPSFLTLFFVRYKCGLSCLLPWLFLASAVIETTARRVASASDYGSMCICAQEALAAIVAIVAPSIVQIHVQTRTCALGRAQADGALQTGGDGTLFIVTQRVSVQIDGSYSMPMLCSSREGRQVIVPKVYFVKFPELAQIRREHMERIVSRVQFTQAHHLGIILILRKAFQPIVVDV